jgi:hypothetical protein
MTNRERVLNWIQANFDTDQIKLEEFSLMPGGHRIIDRDGNEMLVYWDIANQQVKWVYPDKTR